MFGLGDSATTVPRQRIHDLFHPEDRSRIHLAINDCLASEGAGRFPMGARYRHRSMGRSMVCCDRRRQGRTEDR